MCWELAFLTDPNPSFKRSKVRLSPLSLYSYLGQGLHHRVQQSPDPLRHFEELEHARNPEHAHHPDDGWINGENLGNDDILKHLEFMLKRPKQIMKLCEWSFDHQGHKQFFWNKSSPVVPNGSWIPNPFENSFLVPLELWSVQTFMISLTVFKIAI